MDVILRAAVSYLLLVILLRITTRRMVRSATPLDMAIIFLFGGFVTQAVLGQDRSLTNGFLAVVTVAGMHVLISLLKPRWGFIGNVTEGTPVIIFKDGKFDHRRLKNVRVQEKDVRAEMHMNGVRDMDEVEYVVVEHNGGIAIIRKNG